MKKYAFYILFICLSVLSYSQKHIVGKTDKQVYMLGDRINYSFSIPKQNSKVVLSTSFQFSDTLTLISQNTDTSQNELVYNLVFTSFANGEITLPEYSIYKQSTGQNLYIVSSPTIKINHPVIDTINIEAKELKGIRKAPITFEEVAFVSLLVIALAGVILLIIYLIRYIRKRKSNKELHETSPKITLEREDEEALKSLEALSKANYIANQQTKQHYILLTDIVWRYIFRRFGINAFEMTSRQIIDGLRAKKLSLEDISKVRSLFEIADLVKFAKHQPMDTENIDTMKKAKDFVISNGHITLSEDVDKNKEEEARQ
ncbi:MAG: hypothetical protein Q4Q06_00730 [Bacteroidota bacterium]|nr:hypothetical protein [Bacteroidota bacterium]